MYKGLSNTIFLNGLLFSREGGAQSDKYNQVKDYGISG